jgi:uncharacterized MAPEG superfamily protein
MDRFLFVVLIGIVMVGAFASGYATRRGAPNRKAIGRGLVASLTGVAALVLATHENLATVLAVFAGSAFVASAVAQERP